MPLIPRFTLGIPHPTRLAVGVTQGKRLSLIPGFTLGITYPTQGHPLLLAILKAMYVSCSREHFLVQCISQVMDNSCSRILPKALTAESIDASFWEHGMSIPVS